ncbi:MAG: peptidoglycan-binding protein, partial [Dactylosporangium sp.]|nr:peptidoglycan-binding protein [Dactylosporangium sp.]NNJ63629.1 peptidoglycan-binding protein [Dactylosporangium sp.]
WPQVPVKATTRRVAVARARRWLGEGGDGRPWLPDATAERRYRLREGYLLDWHLFRRLRTRGETRGPAGGGDLRQALGLVRGAPLAGADVAYSVAARNPYAWLPASDIQPHHLAAAVVDTAHRLVGLCLDGGDVGGARWAVERAWLADPDRASDVVWRDLLRVAAAEGNRAELDHLLGALMVARDAEVPEDLDRETYRLLCVLMGERIGVR